MLQHKLLRRNICVRDLWVELWIDPGILKIVQFYQILDGYYSGCNRRADAFRAAGHERALAVKFEIAAHQRISNE